MDPNIDVEAAETVVGARVGATVGLLVAPIASARLAEAADSRIGIAFRTVVIVGRQVALGPVDLHEAYSAPSSVVAIARTRARRAAR